MLELTGYSKVGMYKTPPGFRRLLAFCAALSLTLSSQIATANNHGDNLSGSIFATTQDPAVLTINQSQDREIKGDEVHSFSITLGLNQLARLLVQRHGIDLVISVISPDSSLAAKFENPSGPESPIFGLIKAETSGNYTVEVRPARKWLPQGSYEIQLQEVQLPSLRDEKKLLAQRKVFEGRRQQSLDTSDGWRAALASYEESLTFWREAADAFEEANTLQLIARTYRSLGDLKQAEAYLNSALEIRLTDPPGRAYTLLDLADAYYSLKSPRDSLPKYEEVLGIFKETNNRRGQALVLAQIGLVHMRLFDWQRAQKILESALEFERSSGNVYEETRVLNALGGVFDNQLQPEKALEYYKRAGDGFHRLGASAREGNVHINIGLHYDTWGEWREAVTYYNSALKLIADGHAAGEVDQPYVNSKNAALFYNLGSLYISLGAYTEGLGYLQKSLDLRTPNERGATLNWLAYAYILLGQPEQALNRCREALVVQEPARDPRRAQTYTVMGLAEQALGNHEKAVELFNRAFEIQNSKETPDRKGLAITLDNRSASFAATQEVHKARKDLEDALALWRKFKDRNGEALSLFHLARLNRDTGDVNSGLANAEAAIKLVEPLRKNVVGQQLRASYFATKVDYYELYIDLIMLSGENDPGTRASVGFEASERERARGLLDTLSETNIESKTPGDSTLAALLERRRLLQRSMIATSFQRSQVLLRNFGAKELPDLDRQLAAVTTDQESLEKQIRLQYPNYAALTFSEPLRAKQIQRELDPDTLLLEFALGEKRSYVWAVSPDDINAFELPGRDQIESLAHRVTKSLTARNREDKNESFSQRQLRVDTAEKEYAEASAALSKFVLAPVASLLGNKRLVVVADGALQTVPFAALPPPAIPAASETAKSASPNIVIAKHSGALANSAVPKSSRSEANAAFTFASGPTTLVGSHEIITLPSASVLALQRREMANRKPAPLAVAVFADPVFDLEDMRVAKATRNGNQHRKNPVAPGQTGTGRSKQAEPSSPAPPGQGAQGSSTLSGSPKEESLLTTALRDVGLDQDGKLPRLSLSRQEARAIARAVSPSQSLSALDFKASRQTATSPELSKYRIIHFATHGVMDLEHPELSGIVLSMVDEKGQPQDGYLRLHEIYNLNLPAELVVLSACQTGIGKQVKGEGLIALTRGFMYAGAKSVVASLWKVDDAATSELMAEFYKQMFTNKLKPAAALRAAQIHISKQKRWQSPYYWAGFFLQGEWN